VEFCISVVLHEANVKPTIFSTAAFFFLSRPYSICMMVMWPYHVMTSTAFILLDSVNVSNWATRSIS